MLAVLGYIDHGFTLAVILVLSLAALGYFLFQAPVWCCAVTQSGQPCREKSHGLLIGCWQRQHTRQRLRETFTAAGGRAMLSAGKSASGLIALLCAAVAAVQLLIAAGSMIPY